VTNRDAETAGAFHHDKHDSRDHDHLILPQVDMLMVIILSLTLEILSGLDKKERVEKKEGGYFKKWP
jgi:hypothetical protein